MDKELKQFLHGVVGVTVATSFEKHSLWKENHESQTKLSWEDRLNGLGQQMGKIGKRPIYCSLQTAVIDGYKILFVEPTSALVDHDMIESWLKENLPVTAFVDNDPRKRINMSDPMNFHNVLHHLKWAEEQAAKQESEL